MVSCGGLARLQLLSLQPPNARRGGAASRLPVRLADGCVLSSLPWPAWWRLCCRVRRKVDGALWTTKAAPHFRFAVQEGGQPSGDQLPLQ